MVSCSCMNKVSATNKEIVSPVFYQTTYSLLQLTYTRIYNVPRIVISNILYFLNDFVAFKKNMSYLFNVSA